MTPVRLALTTVGVLVLVACSDGAGSAQQPSPATVGSAEAEAMAVLEADTTLRCMRIRGFDVTPDELTATEVPPRFSGPAFLRSLYGDGANLLEVLDLEAATALAREVGEDRFDDTYGCGELARLFSRMEIEPERYIEVEEWEAPDPMDDPVIAGAVYDWRDCIDAQGISPDYANPDELWSRISELTLELPPAPDFLPSEVQPTSPPTSVLDLEPVEALQAADAACTPAFVEVFEARVAELTEQGFGPG